MKQLRRVSNLSALKSLPVGASNDGECCYVDGAGLYRYEFTNLETTYEPLVISPDFGEGRWLQENSRQKVHIVDMIEHGRNQTLHTIVQAAITSLDSIDVQDMKGTVTNVKEGDKVLLGGVISARISSITNTPTVKGGFIYLQLEDTLPTTISMLQITDVDNKIREYQFSPKVFTIRPGTSSFTIKVSAKLEQPGLQLDIFSPVHIQAQILRPSFS